MMKTPIPSGGKVYRSKDFPAEPSALMVTVLTEMMVGKELMNALCVQDLFSGLCAGAALPVQAPQRFPYLADGGCHSLHLEEGTGDVAARRALVGG